MNVRDKLRILESGELAVLEAFMRVLTWLYHSIDPQAQDTFSRWNATKRLHRIIGSKTAQGHLDRL